MPKTPQRVAFIGLGAMGFPMAARLAGDFSVAAFDVSSERRTLAVDSGATIADSPAQASRDADVVGSEGRTCSGPLAAAAHQLYLLAEAAGLGACDDSTIVTVLSPTVKEN
jgi:3-hydroxyisobutyrate dehydrogenase